MQNQSKNNYIMKSLLPFAVCLFLILITNKRLEAQNKIVKNFTLVNVATNQNVSLSDYATSKAIVVVFTSNHCPYSKLYEERIKSLWDKYAAKGVQFILINPNNPVLSKADSFEEITRKIKSENILIPYLADQEQKVGNIFGATKTPEVFLVQNQGSQFTIVYNGAIDDNPQSPSDVKAFYLADALESVLANKAPAPRTFKATGCMIKKN